MSIPLYKDKNADIEDRIKDLLSRMTLEEKARQIDQYAGNEFADKIHPFQRTAMAPDANILWDKVEKVFGDIGIGCIHDLYAPPEISNALQEYAMKKTRLGIPILFSEECLHGFIYPGCTIFPQQITLASTFNPKTVYNVGRSIAAETRSFGIHETFSPVLDLCREPRWGRIEEGYGEDTYLASRMAVAMCKGLQGDSLSSCDSIIAEPKHYAGYGVTTGGINCTNATIGERELFTYYLPVFKAAVMEGGALNIMSSYNAVDCIPLSSNYRLLTEILKKEWGLKGFVRADCGAVSRLVHEHFAAKTSEDAIEQSFNAGVDMQYYDNPHDLYQQTIVKLVQEGRIAVERLDDAVARVLRCKFLLGLFENPYVDTSLHKKVIRCEKHQEIALKAAREGICLLKNTGLLPLKRNLKKIAVIGPNANVACVGDYSPVIHGFEPVTLLDGIRRMVTGNTEVVYARGCAVTGLEISPIPKSWLTAKTGENKWEGGLLGKYFNNYNFDGEPTMIRLDENIDFDWMTSVPFGPSDRYGGKSMDEFTVRWEGWINIPDDFEGTLIIESNDEAKVWIDDELAMDTSENKRSLTYRKCGKERRNGKIQIDYKKRRGGGKILLGWRTPDEWVDEAVNISRDADVAIVSVGDSENTCGEWVDRADLNLPGRQLELVKEVHKTGVPVILVLQNGRPMAIKWEAENIPAIIEAWYPGEKGGLAIAEVIFGEYNPAGRIPVSFPRATGQIPVHYNRLPGGGKRYVEMDIKPLFPFGHGLSYTTFEYSGLNIEPGTVQLSTKMEINITFNVKNTGKMAGDEVVQLYIRDMVSSVVRPLKELRRFERISLKPGESSEINFKLGFEDLKLLNRDFEWVVEPGEFQVMVGASSEDIRLSGNFKIVKNINS